MDSRTIRCRTCSTDVIYIGVGRPPLYCMSCIDVQRRLKTRRWRAKNRHRIIGTTDLNEHPQADHRREYEVVSRELYRNRLISLSELRRRLRSKKVNL